MASFNIPAGPKTFEINLSSFLGVDFSSSMTDIDKRRTPNGYNFVNNNGTIEKRNGYEVVISNLFTVAAILNTEGADTENLRGHDTINGVWNIDIPGQSGVEEYLIIHVGRGLYKVKPSDLMSTTLLFDNMYDVKSKGIIFDKKLIIFDSYKARAINLNDGTADYLEDIAYIPTTQIARSPNGLASQSYEQPNLLCGVKKNMFTGTATDTVYQLDEKNINSVISVEVMDSNGDFQRKTATTDYTVDRVNGRVIFNSPVGLPPVDGRDNVRITYEDESVPFYSSIEINASTIARVYGYGGANNRIFLSGNSTFPNSVFWSAIDNPTYFPVTNVINLGLETSQINELIKTNDGKLVALKPTSDTDSTAFYISYAMMDGEEWFPLEKSIKGEGNIGKCAYDTLIDEPLILTKGGIYALNSAIMTDEKFLYHRSYYIDTKLKQESNLENAVGISFDGKYYLAINNHVYVADSRFKSVNKNAKYSNFQYEWYYWTDVPVTTWFIWNNELYFGDTKGCICKFKGDSSATRFWDTRNDVYASIDGGYTDRGAPVKAEWNTPILDLNNPAYKKNIKRIAIQSNPTNSKLTVGYRLKGGDKQVISKEYINSTYPKTTMIRKKAKKLSFFSLYIENDEDSNMSFNSVDVVYTVGSFYKGD